MSASLENCEHDRDRPQQKAVDVTSWNDRNCFTGGNCCSYGKSKEKKGAAGVGGSRGGPGGWAQGGPGVGSQPAVSGDLPAGPSELLWASGGQNAQTVL
ncbi:hypothetical protein ACOMHN_012705 [Nucella lapillus]